MPDGRAQRDAAAHRVTHYIGLFDPEMLHQRGNIVRHGFEAERPVDIGGVSVALQIHGDHAAASREQRQILAEHLTGPQRAMDQDQRFSLAVEFVIEIEAVTGA